MLSHGNKGNVNEFLIMAGSSFANNKGIITLQIGHYSNYVGTHWWNIQQSSKRAQERNNEKTEIDHGLFLREDIEPRTGRTTHTPRLLCIDLKGSLKALKEDGSFQKRYGEERSGNVQQNNDGNELEADNIAPNSLSIYQTELMQRPALVDTADSSVRNRLEQANSSPVHEIHHHEPNYLSFDDTVEVWSDFLGSNYHQNSILLLDDYWHNSDSCSFSSFGQGFLTTENNKFWDSWEDRMHFFAEECDQLQGFQVITDLEDGFGGLTVRVLEDLKDCYGPKSFAIYGCWPGVSNQYINENIEIMNSALAMSCITQHSQLFTPMSLQEAFYGKEKSTRRFMYLSYKPGSQYHTSAIIASYLDTISLQYRVGDASIMDFCNAMTVTGHNVASANMSLPLKVTSPSIEDILNSNIYENGVMTSLTPSVGSVLPTLFSHQMVLRGIPSEFEHFGTNAMRINKRISNKDIFERYVFNTYKTYKTGTTFCEDPLQTFHAYARCSKSTFANVSFLPPSGEFNGSFDKVPVLSSLSTTVAVFDLFHDIIKSVRRVKDSIQMPTEYFGMEKDEINENIEHLVNSAHLYDEKRATELL